MKLDYFNLHFAWKFAIEPLQLAIGMHLPGVLMLLIVMQREQLY